MVSGDLAGEKGTLVGWASWSVGLISILKIGHMAEKLNHHGRSLLSCDKKVLVGEIRIRKGGLLSVPHIAVGVDLDPG